MAIKTQRLVDPFPDAATRRTAWRFGMWLFLVVVAMLFGAAILGFLVVRLDPERVEAWRPEGSPGLPHLLLLSTAVLVGVSLAHHAAVLAADREDRVGCGRRMTAAAVLAVLFLALQAWSWRDLWTEQVRLDDSLFAWTFYVLTGVHALHVLGGVVPLAIVAHRARRGRYGAADHEGVVLSAMYWHALDAIWVVLYLALWLGSG